MILIFAFHAICFFDSHFRHYAPLRHYEFAADIAATPPPDFFREAPMPDTTPSPLSRLIAADTPPPRHFRAAAAAAAAAAYATPCHIVLPRLLLSGCI